MFFGIPFKYDSIALSINLMQIKCELQSDLNMKNGVNEEFAVLNSKMQLNCSGFKTHFHFTLFENSVGTFPFHNNKIFSFTERKTIEI